MRASRPTRDESRTAISAATQPPELQTDYDNVTKVELLEPFEVQIGKVFDRVAPVRAGG